MAFEELRVGFETGNLVLLRRIGAGAMGTVWLAEHRTLRTRVAVKFVTEELLLGDPVALERFAREAEILARLKSPHIVQVLDRAMTNSGVPYLVMELLEGETLSRHLARRGPTSLAIVRRVVEHVAKALTKAHALGVVHRDIKPDNIFLARTDEGLVCKVVSASARQASSQGRSPG
ncbi:MAG: serine/threonine protein kinase [Deltaproteobacteria bacterium]|nr:serine/threonine protein kinase [Deltaproteobacteria bacterium]